MKNFISICVLIIITATLCVAQVVHDNVTAICRDRTIHINTAKKQGYVFSNGIQFHFVGGDSVMVKCDNYDAIAAHVPDDIVYKNKRYKVTGLMKAGWKSIQRLDTVTLPENITDIPTECFRFCYQLRNFQFPQGIRKIGSAAFSRVPFTRLELPDSLRSIGEMAFYECSSLEYLVLPEKLEYIGESAFRGCSLDTVKVLFKQPIPLNTLSFWLYADGRHPRRRIVLLVPCGTKEVYQNAEGWRKFQQIEEY